MVVGEAKSKLQVAILDIEQHFSQHGPRSVTLISDRLWQLEELYVTLTSFTVCVTPRNTDKLLHHFCGDDVSQADEAHCFWFLII